MSKSKKTLIIIPARLKSSRVPEKVLIDLGGQSMIQRVYKICLRSKLADRVIVATDSQKVIKNIQAIGGEAIMTSNRPECGTDRVAEVARKMPQYAHFIDVQGDKPLLVPKVIDDLIKGFQKSHADMVTLCTQITDPKQINNPSVVKLVKTKDNYAMFMSRLPIPLNRDNETGINYYRHVGLYGYTRQCLLKFARLKSMTEKAEKVELLRLLENGYKVKLVMTNHNEVSVNTPEELKIVQQIFNQKHSKKKSF